jgi:beta-glucosidase
VDVTNTGKVAGKEIVQLYVRDVKSTFARPVKELKAFAKVELKPKQKKTVTFTLDREAFWYFDTLRNAWRTEPGEFEILVGASSRDIRERGSVMLQPEPRASRLHAGLAINTLLADPDGHAIVSKYLAGILIMEDIKMVGDFTLEQVVASRPNFVSKESLAKIEKDLEKIK